MKKNHKQPTSIDSQVSEAIFSRGYGSVFVPSDFLDLGSREAIDVILHRLVRKRVIRRLARGVYDLPETHPVLGWLQPSPEKVAAAVAGRDCTLIQPTGAYAANLLGLSEQVPAKVVFLTDGPSRTLKVGSTTIQLRRTTAKKMAVAGRLSGLLIQALSEFGKESVSKERIDRLKQTIPLDKRQELLKDLRFAPEWMHPIFRELAEKNK